MVYVESYFGDKIISGKKCTEKELREKFRKAIETSQSENFVRIFCSMFEFEEIDFKKDVRVDFVIDLDTYLVYTPT